MGEDGKSETEKNCRRTGDWNKLATVQMHSNFQCVANGSRSQLSLWLPSFLSLGHYSIIHLTVTNFPCSSFIANWITVLQLWSYFNWIVILLHWKKRYLIERTHYHFILKIVYLEKVYSKSSYETDWLRVSEGSWLLCQRWICFTYTCFIMVWYEVWN